MTATQERTESQDYIREQLLNGDWKQKIPSLYPNECRRWTCRPTMFCTQSESCLAGSTEIANSVTTYRDIYYIYIY